MIEYGIIVVLISFVIALFYRCRSLVRQVEQLEAQLDSLRNELYKRYSH
jgi:Flp pilus assembly pilin Flp